MSKFRLIAVLLFIMQYAFATDYATFSDAKMEACRVAARDQIFEGLPYMNDIQQQTLIIAVISAVYSNDFSILSRISASEVFANRSGIEVRLWIWCYVGFVTGYRYKEEH